MVVIGHLWYQSNLPIINTAIYSFHMPLFFLISGFVIRSEYRDSVREYIKKQTIRLFLPAFIYVIMFLPIYLITANEQIVLWKTVKKICFWDGRVPYNDPCWFFFVLYEAKILERILNTASRCIWLKWLTCVSAFLLGYAVYEMNIFLPFGLDRCLVGFGFMIAGMCMKDVYLRCWMVKRSQRIVFCVITFLAWILLGIVFNMKVSMYAFELGSYWCFVLSGICGSVFFIMLCNKIDEKVSIFRSWAQNTIFIICTHYFFVSVFKKITSCIDIQYTWLYDVSAIIFAAVLIYCYLPVCELINEHIPFLNGRRKDQDESRKAC